MVTLNWLGDQVQANLLEASRQGVDATLSVSTAVAKPYTRIRTGTYRRSIFPDPAQIDGAVVSAIWGSHDVNYAYFQLLFATSLHDGQPGDRSLFFGADAAYPMLGSFIAEALRRL